MILCDEEKRFMRWKWFYQVRDYLKSSLWIVPLVAIPLELAAIRILQRLDSSLGWSFLGLGKTGADAMLNAIVTATLSFVVFTFWIAARRASSCKRTNDAKDYCHHLGAQQRR